MSNKTYHYFISVIICILIPLLSFSATTGSFIGTCNNLIPCTNDCMSNTFDHVANLVGNIFNCLLWTISPIYIICLVVYSGILIYSSPDNPKDITEVQKKWKTFGQGWVIMLLGWTTLKVIIKLIFQPV